MDIWSPLAAGQVPQHYQSGQFIYRQGDNAHTFYYLISGTARSIISSEAGGERELTVHKAGDLMGEASFFDGCLRVSSAVAVTRCQAVSVNQAWLDHVFRVHPELAMPMLQYLARTVRLLSDHVNGMSFLQADQRVARQLLALSDGTGAPIPATHEALGVSVGASRVTVSRVLGEFVRRGWVETGYKYVRVLDESALERLCAGE